MIYWARPGKESVGYQFSSASTEISFLLDGTGGTGTDLPAKVNRLVNYSSAGLVVARASISR